MQARLDSHIHPGGPHTMGRSADDGSDDRGTKRLAAPSSPQLVHMPPPPPDPPWLRRWQRARLVVLGIVGAIVLVSGVLSYVVVDGAARTVVSGHGEKLLNSVNRALIRGHQTPQIEAVLAEYAPLGLRGVVLLAPGGRALGSAGQVQPPDGRTISNMRPREPYANGDLVWMVHIPPPDPGGGPIPTPYSEPGPPPPGLESRPGLPDRPPPPPAFAITFEPLEARTLRRAALVALVAAFVAALALGLSALGLWAIQRRLDAGRQADERGRRLAALGEMSAVLAHEIRNPLAGLKGSAQLLVEALPEEGSRNRARAERVVREALRIERLTTDLLSLVRSGEVHRQPCSPGELLHEAARSVSAELIHVVDEAPERWSLDPERLRQALCNLMENALHASPEGAEACARVVDGELELSVRDHGPGVPLDQRDRIFEAFTTGRAQGTGLGLAVTRRVVDLHGGTITIDDHPDGGAIFRVRIPRRA